VAELVMSSHARSVAVRTARQVLNTNPVYLDTETTGLLADAEIIEMAIVDNAGEVLCEQLIRPQNIIPQEAIAIHHITNEMVADQPTWDEVWPAVRALLNGKTVCMYNAEFDMRLIDQSNDRYAIRRERFAAFDVMKLFAQFRGVINHRSNTYRWFRLEQAGAFCGIVIPNAHRAREDTLLTRAVLHWIAAQPV
jgi:DNA polymerase III subunit epsilon